MSRSRLVAITGALLSCSVILAAPATLGAQVTAQVPSPQVTGPVPPTAPPGDPSRGYTFFSAVQDLEAAGFVEEEYFIEGEASRYDLPEDGSTGSVIDAGHAYRTRMVVRRPSSPERFNGAVLLEWQNVTAGYDLDALWSTNWPHILREGYAWIGLSAQRVGVDQLRQWSPVRYGSLDVTAGGTILDDALSYDIFSQAAKAVRAPSGIDVMGGLDVLYVIAIGASQSARFMTPYYNSVLPLAEPVFDGVALVVGGGVVRSDLETPVFMILAETDVPSRVATRQPDTSTYRRWEVAGAAHSGYTGFVSRRPVIARDIGPQPFPECDAPPFSRVPFHYATNAAYDHLVRWAASGTPPPVAPPIELVSVDPPIIARDAFGIALGGIRFADVDVPTAINTGVNTGAAFCRLYGTHIPFTEETLRYLYPTPSEYVAAVNRVTNANLWAGFMVSADAQEARVEAAPWDVAHAA